MSYKKYLEDIYFNPSHAGAFAGLEKLYKVVKNEAKYQLSRKQIKEWLQNRDEYTVQRDVKRKFNRRKIVVSGIDTQWGIDLASVENISKFNDGIKYLLVAVDVFSKYLFVEPLEGRKAKDVVNGFERILAHGRILEIVFF